MGERFHHPVKHPMHIAAGAVAALLLVFAVWNQYLKSAEIVLGGDLMLARSGNAILADVSAFGDALSILQNADLTMANLESPLSTSNPIRAGTGYDLCAPAKETSVLGEAGFDLLTIANNHQDDCEPGGATESSLVLQQAGIAAAGVDLEPSIIQLRGWKIAILAVDDVSQPFNIDLLQRAIFNARSKADLVIISIHWGNEYQAGPDEQQRAIAQTLVDSGADVIWGHHPHVLQRMEWLQSADLMHRALVIYSLGNLVSDQNMTDDVRREALIRLRIQGGQIAGVEVVPLIREISSSELKTAAGQERQSILDRLHWSEIVSQLSN